MVACLVTRGMTVTNVYPETGMSTTQTVHGEGAPMAEPGFDQMLERHRRELHVHCYRMLGSFTDAEDLVQETFLRAWRNRDRRQPGTNLRASLYRIATNACTDVIRSRRRQAAAPASSAPEQQRPECQPRCPGCSRIPTRCWTRSRTATPARRPPPWPSRPSS